MSPALLDALPDFSSPASPARRGLGAFDHPSFEAAPSHEVDPGSALPGENGDATADAIAAAEEAITRRLTEEHEAALTAERERHAEELDAARLSLAEQAGEKIRDRFDEMERNVTTLAGSATARILSVLLTEDLQQRSVAELERIIRAALQDRETVRIRLSGAPLLWEALKAGLGEKANHVDFAEAPGMDISLSIDERLFETRLTEWSETLAELNP